jgi:hypothetical protein
MTTSIPARRWVRIALVYFLLAVTLGVGMAASHDFRLKGLHGHLNLLGWVSLSVTALVYQVFPQAARTLAAHVHFWLYNLSLPVMMAALTGILLGHEAFEPVIAVSSVCVLLSVVVFVVNVWRASGDVVEAPGLRGLQTVA